VLDDVGKAAGMKGVTVVQGSGPFSRKSQHLLLVMPGLVPGIHALPLALLRKRGWPGQARP
jgi:hypothetical protein